MPVINVVGNMPALVKKAKTKEEIVHSFNKVYALSVTSAFDVQNIQNFEENILKDIEMFKLNIEKCDREKSWLLLQLLFMRRAMKCIPDNDYAVQIIELLINSHSHVDLEELRKNTLATYSIYMLKNGEGGLNPRQSQIDEPLPHIPSLIYMAMFNKKKTIINFLYKNLTLDKLDCEPIDGFFSSISFNNKKEYIEAAYDIVFNTVMNAMTTECEDNYDYENCSDEDLTSIIMEIKQSVNMGLNAFIHDVGVINDCSSKITEVVINETLRLQMYQENDESKE